jgi:hypothetical protein
MRMEIRTTHGSEVEVIENVTACFPYRRAAVLLLTFVYSSTFRFEKLGGYNLARHPP